VLLLRFEVANHRSMLNPVELSMIAVDEDRPAARSFERLSERVLTVAGIYGPNASGKSNVIDALYWLSMAVANSLRRWDQAVPTDPFKFGRGPESPSVFDAELMVGGVRYAYRLETTGSAVQYEALYSYPERRRRVLFEREDLEISFRRGLGALAGTRELLTPTTLALSAAMRFEDEEVGPFGRYLARIWGRGLRRRRRLMDMKVTDTDDIFHAAEASREKEMALALLRFADVGVEDVEAGELEDEAGNALPYLRLIHRARGERLAFEMRQESAGTRAWFNVIGPIISVLRSGEIMLFDEIDASLHPKLSARLLELFQDPETNPRGAQLIFTTHDTSLLNHLNRDEVWLTQKGDDGATTLTALAEYGGDKVRRSLNLEKAYLQGRFGAVPELDQYTLRRALGMATSGD
jgi:predicted ATPase